MEERLFNLEKNCSYLEDKCEKLSEALISADSEIEKLKKRLIDIEASVNTQEIRPIEKPPHY